MDLKEIVLSAFHNAAADTLIIIMVNANQMQLHAFMVILKTIIIATLVLHAKKTVSFVGI